MDVFNNLWVISECLLDKDRTTFFKQAIKKIVKKGDIVVDAGTGSAILALFAAKAGAKKVYAVEIASDLTKLAQSNINRNGLQNTIEVVTSDVAKFKLPRNQAADVLIMEMMDTGLVAEQQAYAMQGLKHNKVIGNKTKLIPDRVDCALGLVNYNFNFYGVKMEFIIAARNNGVLDRIKNTLSDTVIYKTIHFNNVPSLKLDERIVVPIIKAGTINAMLLKTKAYLANLSTWATNDMNMPYIVPLLKRRVAPGDQVNLRLSYTMSSGFESFQVNWA